VTAPLKRGALLYSSVNIRKTPVYSLPLLRGGGTACRDGEVTKRFFVFLLTIKSIYVIISKVKSHYRLFQVYQMIMVVSKAPRVEGISYDIYRNLSVDRQCM
jgi:hypothetical protein